MNYTLHQLEIFLKIVELGSITKASEALFLTQPAVSIQLKNFQDQFPIPLTEIVGRKIFITDFGLEIAEASKNIISEVKAINHKVLAFQGKLSGKLKISIVSTAKYVMPFFLAEFMNKHEGVELEMNVTNKGSVVENLENNEVDFAMVSVLPPKLKLNTIELMKNKLFLVGGKQYHLKRKYFGLKEFESLSLLYREKGSATRNAMEEFMRSKKLPNYKKIELTSNEALKQAIVAGLGFSIMPLIGLKNELKNGDLQILPVKELPITTHWNLVWLQQKKLSPTAQAYLEYVKSNKADIINKHFSWFENYA